MPITWKEAERVAARWGGILRLPSTGRVQADCAPEVGDDGKPVDDYTFEVKSRDIASFPKWLLGAFDQAALHPAIHKTKDSYVLLNLRFGRGKQQRWFICREFAPATDAFTSIRERLEAARDALQAELDNLTAETSAEASTGGDGDDE